MGSNGGQKLRVWWTPTLGVACSILLLATSLPAAAQDYGVPVSGYPNWHERAVHILVNMVRADPTYYRDVYMTDWPADASGILQPATYPAVDPVYWDLALNQVARYHSEDIANTPGCSPSHYSCDGTPPSTRVSAVYTPDIWVGECLAWGGALVDPRVVVNLWLCMTSTGECFTDGDDDYYRSTIMKAVAEELGSGYATGSNVSNTWTQDFGRINGSFVPPSPIASAGHLFLGDGSVTFLLNFMDSAPPQSVTLVLDGVDELMTLQSGATTRGTYEASSGLTGSCRSYHFVFVDSTGQALRYPESGEYRTFNEGGCAEDWTALGVGEIFSDDFESGTTSSWSSTVP